MKLLYCISSLSGGGTERQIGYLLPELVKRGIETHVAFLFEGPIPSKLEKGRVFMHPIKHCSNYDPMIILRLIAKIKEIQPDIVQSSIVQMDIFTGIACYMTSTPWIFREGNSEVAAKHRGKKESLRRLLSGWAACIVANSQSGLDYWENILPNTKKKLIENGLPNDIFVELQRTDSREISSGNILYAGRLTAHKNVPTLIAAMARSCIKNKTRLVICGEGEEKEHLMKLATEFNISKKVDFLGYIDQQQLLQIMRNAMLFVNPSSYEGCPNTILEAMASCCPIAVSDIPAHRAILNENSAFFFKTKNIDELITTLNNSWDYKDLFAKASEANRLATKFSVNEMVDKYISVYQNIIRS